MSIEEAIEALKAFLEEMPESTAAEAIRVLLEEVYGWLEK